VAAATFEFGFLSRVGAGVDQVLPRSCDRLENTTPRANQKNCTTPPGPRPAQPPAAANAEEGRRRTPRVWFRV